MSKSGTALDRLEKKDNSTPNHSTSEDRRGDSCLLLTTTSASLRAGYEHVDTNREEMSQSTPKSNSSSLPPSPVFKPETSSSTGSESLEEGVAPQQLSALPIRQIPEVKKDHRQRDRLDLKSLIDKRMAVLGTRMRVEESRNALRNIREDLMNMDARFTQDLRNLAARSANRELKILINQNEAIQKVREELQLQESDYNVLEDGLNRAEWGMQEDENRVYKQLSNAEGREILDYIGYSSEGDVVDRVSSGSAPSTPSSTFPIKQQKLSRMGDRELLVEQLQELRAERAYWVEQEIIRRRVDRVLDEEGQHFLRTFDTRHTTLLEDLRRVEVDLARLQESLDAHADVRYASTQFDGEGEILHTPSDEPDDPDLASKDPLFLDSSKVVDKGDGSRPTSSVFSNVAVDANGESISTVSFINAWLLHILRRSVLEVRRYKTMKELQPLGLDRDRLAELVLEWWSKDGTVNLFPQARKYSARSESLTSKAINQDQTTRPRSDKVLLDIHSFARRLESSHNLRAERGAGKTTYYGVNILGHSHHARTPTI